MEFWRTLLALGNGLFFSLACGLVISAVSRDALKTMSATLLLEAIILGGLPLLDFWRADWDATKFHPILTYASPVYAFLLAPPIGKGAFWQALGTSDAICWSLILLGSLTLPQSWQEKATSQARRTTARLRHWRFMSSRRRMKWLGTNPLVWLAGRDLWLTWCALIVALCASGLAALLYLRMEPDQFGEIVGTIQVLLIVTLGLWTAAQANRLSGEMRRTGIAELILCMPVTVRQILKSLWAGLQLMFVVPLCIILVFQVVTTIGSVQAMGTLMAGQKPILTLVGTVFNQYQVSQILDGISSGICFVTAICALAWFGMWMGLTNRKGTVGILRTVAFVVVLPWIGLLIGQISISSLMARPRWPFWADTAMFSLAWVCKDVFFILWSRWRLRTAFRDAVAFGQAGRTLFWRKVLAQAREAVTIRPQQ